MATSLFHTHTFPNIEEIHLFWMKSKATSILYPDSVCSTLRLDSTLIWFFVIHQILNCHQEHFSMFHYTIEVVRVVMIGLENWKMEY